jgi:uncharacterized membrane protein YgcG
MEHRVRTAVWAIACLLFAIALSWAAFAVAGGRISEPAGSVRVAPVGDEEHSEPRPTPSATPGQKQSPTPRSPQPAATGSTATPSPSDDHGGSSGTGGTSSSTSGGGSDDGAGHDADDD